MCVLLLRRNATANCNVEPGCCRKIFTNLPDAPGIYVGVEFGQPRVDLYFEDGNFIKTFPNVMRGMAYGQDNVPVRVSYPEGPSGSSVTRLRKIDNDGTLYSAAHGQVEGMGMLWAPTSTSTSLSGVNSNACV